MDQGAGGHLMFFEKLFAEIEAKDESEARVLLAELSEVVSPVFDRFLTRGTGVQATLSLGSLSVTFQYTIRHVNRILLVQVDGVDLVTLVGTRGKFAVKPWVPLVVVRDMMVAMHHGDASAAESAWSRFQGEATPR